MAAAESFRPITTITEPSIRGLPRFYTSQREVGAEYQPPARGSVVGDILGPAYRNHIVLSAQVVPKSGKLISIIEHCAASPWYDLFSTIPDRALDAFLIKSKVVPIPSQAALEADHFSSYEPIDETKGILTTKVPRRRKTDGTFENGYPKKQRKSKGVPDLIPTKYKRLVTKVETTTVETLGAGDVNNIPTPADPTGDQSDITHEKLNDHEYAKTVGEEIIAESADPLITPSNEDQLYVDHEEIVVEGAAPDTGEHVISSVVEALGNGKAIKRTKLAVSSYTDKTTYTQGNAVKQRKSVGAPTNVPARYKRMVSTAETKTVHALDPSQVENIPSPTGIGSGVVAIDHEKASEQKYVRTETQETLVLNYSAVDEAIQRKPYVEILSRMTPGPSPVLPVTGNGSAQLVADNGTFKIYENTQEIATALPGPAGTEKDEKVFVSIRTNKRYSTSPDVATSTGTSNLIFNDRATQIYEVSEVTSTGKFGPAGIEKQNRPYVELVTENTYSASPTVTGPSGSSKLVYNDGTLQVYEVSVETAIPKEGPAGTEKEAKPYLTISTSKRYSVSPDVTSPSGRSNVIFNNGAVQVYEVLEERVQARPFEFEAGRKGNRLFEERTQSKYSTSPTGIGQNYESQVIYSDEEVTIYKTDSKTIVSRGPVTYPTIISDRVPSVLRGINIFPILRKDKKSDYAVFIDVEEGYEGAFPARVTEYFTEDASLIVENWNPVIFKPKQISHKGITIGFSIGETLHSGFAITERIGSSDPEYQAQTLSRVFAATSPADVPTGYVPFRLVVEPYESGYIVRQIEIRYR